VRRDAVNAALSVVRMPDTRNVWQWAEDEIDFSRVPAYETELKSKYISDYMPYYREIQEGVTDKSVSEIWVLKNSRAGASENCLLVPLHYYVDRGGAHILFVSGNEDHAIDYFERRIKLGLQLAESTRRKLRHAVKNDKTRVYFSDGSITVTWPRNRMAFKGSGYNLVLVDEASIYTDYSIDMLRKRGDNWAFSKIIGVSSPDPEQKRASRDDPIFIEFRNGDQRRWNCTCPKSKEPFVFVMGTRETHGLRWSEGARKDDGTWDYDAVYDSAFYLTPGGARISNADRMDIVRDGFWVPTAKAKAGIRSYHVNSFMSPFKSGDLGAIAVAFLKAKAASTKALKSFVYEYLAEEWNSDIERIDESILDKRVENYLRGESILKDEADRVTLMTVDVQRDHLWYLIRDWKAGGESCLIEWGRCLSWEDVDKIADKMRPAWIGVDAGYGQRTQEVYEECLRRQYIPMKGDDKSKPGLMPFNRTIINPYEGTRRQIEGQSVALTVFHSDTLKLMLVDRMRGDVYGWSIYRGIERDYLLQMTAEERTPTGWVRRRRDNHMFDCETMQICLAMSQGYLIPAMDDPPDTPTDP